MLVRHLLTLLFYPKINTAGEASTPALKLTSGPDVGLLPLVFRSVTKPTGEAALSGRAVRRTMLPQHEQSNG